MAVKVENAGLTIFNENNISERTDIRNGAIMSETVSATSGTVNNVEGQSNSIVNISYLNEQMSKVLHVSNPDLTVTIQPNNNENAYGDYFTVDFNSRISSNYKFVGCQINYVKITSDNAGVFKNKSHMATLVDVDVANATAVFAVYAAQNNGLTRPTRLYNGNDTDTLTAEASILLFLNKTN